MSKRFWNWLLKNLGIHELRQRHFKLENRTKFLEGLVKVGVDIHVQSDSWVVFCIDGKQTYVEFFRLPKSELREIQLLLRDMKKRFGYIKVDTPPYCRDLI